MTRNPALISGSGNIPDGRNAGARGLLLLLLCALPVAAQTGDYEYEIHDGTVTITRYTGPDGEVSIPAVIDGLPVTRVGGRAYATRTNLTSVTIPDSVTSLGSNAFEYCFKLTSITIPASVTAIGERCFASCVGLTRVIIPDGVIHIRDWTFAHCTSLTVVEIPEGLESIGDWAFGYCTELSSITFPGSLRSVGPAAFAGCSRLGSITVLSNQIGEWLLGLSGLTNVTLGDGVTSIADLDLERLMRLESIEVTDLNPTYSTHDGVLLNKEGIDVLFCPRGKRGPYRIHHNVTSVGPYAFYECSVLTGISMGNNVTRIGDSAFEQCRGLTSLVLGNGVTSIGDYALSGCTGLKHFTIPDSVTSVGERALSGCTGLGSVELGHGLVGLNKGLLAECRSLSTITIPDSVTAIGPYAFSGCTALTAVALGKNVTRIGDSAFEDCRGLTSLLFGKHVTSIGWSTFRGCTRLTSVTLPDGLSSIGGYAFSGCTGLTHLRISDSVTSIGEGALSGCTGLTNVELGQGVVGLNSGVFADCTSLTIITIPASVSYIHGWAFSGCIGLRRIEVSPLNGIYSSRDGVLFNKSQTGLLLCPEGRIGDYRMPEGVASIGQGAFHVCARLTSVRMARGVAKIGGFAFSGCTGMMNVEIPDTVIIIGESAFSGCVNLRNLEIADSVSSIGDGAFQQCTSLTNASFGHGLIRIGRGAFSGCTSLMSVVIPNRVTSIDDDAFQCCSRLTELVMGSSVTNIGHGAFLRCRNLTSVVIPDSVTSIGESVFAHCTRLRSVRMGYGVTRIADSAFSGCTGLANVVIPNSVTEIGDAAFSDCHTLTDVVIGKSVRRLGLSAFAGCSNLEDVIIPKSVRDIGWGAFAGCHQLANVYIEGHAPVLQEQEDWPEIPFGSPATIYHLPDTVGWGSEYSGRPTALWLPRIEHSAVEEGGYTCIVRWARDRTVVLEGCDDLANPAWSFVGADVANSPWSVVGVSTQGDGSAVLADAEWARHPRRFYRARGSSGIEIYLPGQVGDTYVIESTTDEAGGWWLTRGWVELTTTTAVWVDPVTTGPRPVYRVQRVMQPVVETIPNMAWIPPGRFTMGSPEDEPGRSEHEGPVTRVALTHDFWIGRYEVTVGEYQALMGPLEGVDPDELILNGAVSGVRWEEAVVYVQRLTEQERVAGRLPTGYVYRLPTEAEWEYACRAGTTTQYSFGDALGYEGLPANGGWLDLHMITSITTGWGRPWQVGPAVGQKQPNPWRLHDMHGSVAEWCQDWWADQLPGGAVADPQGASTGSRRVVRSAFWSGTRGWMMGGYVASAESCRSAARYGAEPESGQMLHGFRVVLGPVEP